MVPFGPATGSSAPESRTRKPSSWHLPKSASLEDPAKLFNSSLEGNVPRAIDVPKDALIDESVLRALIRAAGEFSTRNAV